MLGVLNVINVLIFHLPTGSFLTNIEDVADPLGFSSSIISSLSQSTKGAHLMTPVRALCVQLVDSATMDGRSDLYEEIA